MKAVFYKFNISKKLPQTPSNYIQLNNKKLWTGKDLYTCLKFMHREYSQ